MDIGHINLLSFTPLSIICPLFVNGPNSATYTSPKHNYIDIIFDYTLFVSWLTLCFVVVVGGVVTILKVLAPLPIGFAVFMVHLATIPITGTGINPARSLGAAIIHNKDQAWDHHVRITIQHIYFSLCSLIPLENVWLMVCYYYSGYFGWVRLWVQPLRLSTISLCWGLVRWRRSGPSGANLTFSFDSSQWSKRTKEKIIKRGFYLCRWLEPSNV